MDLLVVLATSDCQDRRNKKTLLLLESETIMDLDLLREPRMDTRLRLKFPGASVGKERPKIFLKVVEGRRDCSLRNLEGRDILVSGHFTP